MQYEQVLETVAQIENLEQQRADVSKQAVRAVEYYCEYSGNMEMNIDRIVEAIPTMGLKQLTELLDRSQQMEAALSAQIDMRYKKIAELKELAAGLDSEIEKLKECF